MARTKTNAVPERTPADFEIGIAEIDSQHRQLFNILATLEKHSGTGYSYEAARDTLADLTNYANVHFAIEESVMRMHRYPDLEAHVAEHQHLRRQLAEFQQRLLDADIATQLYRFIERWLAEHIDVTDRKYVPHLLASRIDPDAR
ncbi:MAG TPA: bacteriohemerythrin [Rhodocyclaceae bacterium]|nr:bacteriohemerythrin [Rhodocyclaceae bacterium]